MSPLSEECATKPPRSSTVPWYVLIVGSLLSFLKFSAALIVALAVVFTPIEIILLNRGVPPAKVRTFDAFLAWRPDATRFVVTDAKPPQLIALGRLEGLVVSGPAAYVFDEQGRLTDWELETGEGGPVTQILEEAGKELDRAGAKDWLEERGQ